MEQVRLSAKEIEIMQLICQEKQSKEIAATIGLAFRTVEKYRERIMEKIGAVNMVGVANYAIVNGYYDPSDKNEPALFKSVKKRNNSIQIVDPVKFLRTNKDQIFMILLITGELAFLWTGYSFGTIELTHAEGLVVPRGLLVEEFYVARRYGILHFEHAQSGFLRIVNFPGSSECSYYGD